MTCCGAMGIRTPDLLHAISRQGIHRSPFPQVTVPQRAWLPVPVLGGCCTFLLCGRRRRSCCYQLEAPRSGHARAGASSTRSGCRRRRPARPQPVSTPSPGSSGRRTGTCSTSGRMHAAPEPPSLRGANHALRGPVSTFGGGAGNSRTRQQRGVLLWSAPGWPVTDRPAGEPDLREPADTFGVSRVRSAWPAARSPRRRR